MDKGQIAMCGAYCGTCQVAVCGNAKGLLHCGLCPDVPCDALRQAFDHPEHGDNGERLANLKAWATRLCSFRRSSWLSANVHFGLYVCRRRRQRFQRAPHNLAECETWRRR